MHLSQRQRPYNVRQTCAHTCFACRNSAMIRVLTPLSTHRCWIEGAYLQSADKRFPENICLAGCNLECLPSSAELYTIGCSSLFAVRRLSLSDNMLHTLPADFNAVMPWISDLDLSKNRVASYPTTLGDCQHLKEVNLIRNPLRSSDWLREILNKWPEFAANPPAQLEVLYLCISCDFAVPHLVWDL